LYGDVNRWTLARLRPEATSALSRASWPFDWLRVSESRGTQHEHALQRTPFIYGLFMREGPANVNDLPMHSPDVPRREQRLSFRRHHRGFHIVAREARDRVERLPQRDDRHQHLLARA